MLKLMDCCHDPVLHNSVDCRGLVFYRTHANTAIVTAHCKNYIVRREILQNEVCAMFNPYKHQLVIACCFTLPSSTASPSPMQASYADMMRLNTKVAPFQPTSFFVLIPVASWAKLSSLERRYDHVQFDQFRNILIEAQGRAADLWSESTSLIRVLDKLKNGFHTDKHRGSKH
ncbi:unnamed protein product [Peronospora belbahrii]|uniref:Uncharacterized protein n=1 Tax=Peronospora belbahrii TaxID=622444 RepID=A0ABN8CX65_9STRA|nr:unnamed protein product [Peronospora belbahrii]